MQNDSLQAMIDTNARTEKERIKYLTQAFE
jgi:hypothetical protein